MADIHMLLVYNLATMALTDVQRFTDGQKALLRYLEVEREHMKDSSVEIVLVAADSEATIRQTHASYFRGAVALADIDFDALLA